MINRSIILGSLKAQSKLLKINSRGCNPNLKFNESLRSPLFGTSSFQFTRYNSTLTEKLEQIKPTEFTSTTVEPVLANVSPTGADSSVEFLQKGFVEPTLVTTNTAEVLSTGPHQLGDLAALGLCNYTPVGLLEKVLEIVNVTTGLPWFGTIVVTTVLIRTLMLPLIINLNKGASKIANVKPEMDAITAKINRAKADRDNFELALQSQKLRELFKKHNLKPFQMILMPVVQIPVMISFFFALQAMSALPVPGFLTGGASWFANLAIADPTYALPIISSLSFLATTELGADMGPGASNQQPWMKSAMRVLAVAMVPLTYTLPSSVFIYWITSNTFSIFQVLTLNNSKVRALLKLPAVQKHKLVGPRKNKNEKKWYSFLTKS